jgi:hypothetical protein
VRTVLGDGHGLLDQFHLLEGAVRLTGIFERAAAVRAFLQRVMARIVDFIGRKRRPLMALVARLAADLALLPAGRPGARRLDDVAGGRLVGGGGVLLQTGDSLLELQNQRFQLGHACLKPPAVRTFWSLRAPHADHTTRTSRPKSPRFSGNP